MTTIDGSELVGVTIDGEEVVEITMDGDVVFLLDASSGETSTVLEDWESGGSSNWGTVNGATVTTTQPYEGTYSLEGSAGDGLQNVRDNEQDHNNLPFYQRIGDKIRTFWYHPLSTSEMSNNCFARWGYGGPWGSSYYAQWDIRNDTLRLLDSSDHTSIGFDSGMNYPGGEWWALEVEWGRDKNDTSNTQHIVRVKDYSDPNNPTVEGTVLVNDTRYDDSVGGHQWYVWNSTTSNFYTDFAGLYGEPQASTIDSFERASLSPSGEYSGDTGGFTIVSDVEIPTTAREGSSVLSDQDSGTSVQEINSTSGLDNYLATNQAGKVYVWGDGFSSGDECYTYFASSGTELDGYAIHVRDNATGFRLLDFQSGSSTILDTLDVAPLNSTWMTMEITRTDNGSDEDLEVRIHNDETGSMLGTLTATGVSSHHSNDGIGFRRQSNTGTTYWDYYHVTSNPTGSLGGSGTLTANGTEVATSRDISLQTYTAPSSGAVDFDLSRVEPVDAAASFGGSGDVTASGTKKATENITLTVYTPPSQDQVDFQLE